MYALNKQIRERVPVAVNISHKRVAIRIMSQRKTEKKTIKFCLIGGIKKIYEYLNKYLSQSKF